MRTSASAGDVRQLLREKGIRHAGVTREGQQLRVRFREPALREQARNVLASDIPDLAITERVPSPAAGRIQLPLARDPADRRRVIVDERGAPSETEYEVLSCAQVNGEPAAVVACRLHTGRTHQIRVHLAARGWPIAGDRVYGRPSPFIARQALHAWRLRLPHPVTREPLAFESRPPDDMRRLLEPHGTIPS